MPDLDSPGGYRIPTKTSLCVTLPKKAEILTSWAYRDRLKYPCRLRNVSFCAQEFRGPDRSYFYSKTFEKCASTSFQVPKDEETSDDDDSDDDDGVAVVKTVKADEKKKRRQAAADLIDVDDDGDEEEEEDSKEAVAVGDRGWYRPKW